MTNKFLPSTSCPNYEINIVQVQALAPLLVHVRRGTYMACNPDQSGVNDIAQETAQD